MVQLRPKYSKLWFVLDLVLYSAVGALLVMAAVKTPNYAAFASLWRTGLKITLPVALVLGIWATQRSRTGTLSQARPPNGRLAALFLFRASDNTGHR